MVVLEETNDTHTHFIVSSAPSRTTYLYYGPSFNESQESAYGHIICRTNRIQITSPWCELKSGAWCYLTGQMFCGSWRSDTRTLYCTCGSFCSKFYTLRTSLAESSVALLVCAARSVRPWNFQSCPAHQVFGTRTTLGCCIQWRCEGSGGSDWV